MKTSRRSLISSRNAAVSVIGIGLMVGSGCPAPPIPGPENENVNDNAGDNLNDNTGDNDNENDNAVGRIDLFVTSPTCTVCHGGLTDSLGNDVSIDAHWKPSLMANAAVDPLFQASVHSEVNRAPSALSDTIEGTCARCHLPMAHTQAVADGTSTRMLGDGFLDPAHPLHHLAIEGVSCALCHQITDAFLDDPAASDGGYYEIDMETAPPDRVIYGPYPEPQQAAVMQASAGYVPVEGAHIEDSGLCATCHNLFTPTLDAAGAIVGEFPEQTPFSEWLASDFGDGLGGDDRTCQSCHMPVAEGSATISRVPAGLNPRTPFHQHQFRGGNVFMLRLLRDNRDGLGLAATTGEFNAAIARAEEFLAEQTADLNVADARLGNGTLEVTFELVNRTGHKFPTSFPSRRAWIHVTVTDAADAVVFESGAVRADGSIAGNAADDDGAAFEPHHQVVTTPGQVQIYEPIMADTDGAVTYTLLRADAYAKDNRLLPAGFDKTTADGTIAVRGNAEVDDDFIGGSDRVMFRVDVDEAGGPFTVTAELLYQSVSYRYAADLREDGAPLIDRFGALYDAADKTPSLIDSTQVTLPRSPG